MEINNVDAEYVRIIEEEEFCDAGFRLRLQEESVLQNRSNGKSWNWLLKLIAICISLAILAMLAIKWIGPFALRKVVVPVTKWEEQAFNSFERVIVIFASLALFPVGLLDKHPKHASILRLAGEGNWLHQFQAVTLLRISPLPYVIFNYVVVATNVNYSPYLLGTLVGVVPDVFIALYSGIFIRSFAEATQDKKTLSTRQLVLNVVGFCASATATAFIGIHTKRRLDRQHEEELIPE
ncbi:hypothetical protein CRYUN_Cryun23aG0148100 [Craigia yunnanensis]